MNKLLWSAVAALTLSACVKLPDQSADKNAPSLQLQTPAITAFPGSTFRVNSIIDDDISQLDDLEVTWKSDMAGVTLSESSNEHALFNFNLDIAPNQTTKLTSTVTDEVGNTTTKSITVEIKAEPFVIIDGGTAEIQTPNTSPLYLTGTYSAKQINLKSADSRASSNHIIDISPNGRFVFYTQQFNNSVWQANLYDSETGINHKVKMGFENRDQNAVASYWSNDSTVLAIEAPHSSDTSQDKLYWVDTNSLTNVDITPNETSVFFDTLTWSDNNTFLEEKPFASLLTTTSASIFDPTADSAISTLVDNSSADNALTSIKVGSAKWATNQLFFIGSTTVTSDPSSTPYTYDLFNWRPSSDTTQKINSPIAAPGITSFSPYVATQIVFTDSSAMYYFNGVDQSILDLPIDTASTSTSKYEWSPDGRLLGLSSTHSNVPDNASSGYWRFATWSPNDVVTTNIEWLEGTVNYDIDNWNWNTNNSSISVLSSDSAADLKDNLLHVNTANTNQANEEAIAASVVQNIVNRDTTGTNIPTNLETNIERSPTGQWQLYWAVDIENSDHTDLWAYNIETADNHNLSKLYDSYDAPISEGVFSAQPGFDNSALKWVSTDIIWTADDELIFKVMEQGGATSTPVTADVRSVSLKTLATAKSLILEPAILTQITRVVGK
ncbi:hypothetical protein KO489_03510 [Reinekea forsetii]|nr:hypothetical protein [Reinekea forsetii]